MNPTVNVPLDNEELQALLWVLETCVKAGGIEAAKRALPIFYKVEQEVAKVNKELETAGQGVQSDA
jgi:glycine cleavage system H lipoate-binding protein